MKRFGYQISFFLLFLALFSSCTASQPIVSIQTSSGVDDIVVEIADNDQERAYGLMQRESVPEGTGMFFVYPESIDASFWMKNMKIPIDMIFITSEKKIDTIYHNVPPCLPDETCAHYASKNPVQYILEVRAGYAEDKGVEIGDEIEFLIP